MQIKLYQNNSEKHRIGKSLTEVASLTGTLKEECSIVSPEILIESSSPITANYAYIPEFNRYYFITEVTCVSANMFRVSMHSDSLESFKDAIKNCTAYITRAQNYYNMYIPDNKLQKSTQRFEQTKRFGNLSTSTFSHDIIICVRVGKQIQLPQQEE